MKFNRFRSTQIQTFIRESLLIVFSVLFALFINKCQNDSQENERTETILANIKKELERNSKSTKRLIAYHTSVLEQLDATPTDSLEGVFFRGNRFLIYDNEIAPQGITQEIFKDIAWRAAEQENISGRISFGKSQLLFETYHQQDNVYNTVTKLGQRAQ